MPFTGVNVKCLTLQHSDTALFELPIYLLLHPTLPYISGVNVASPSPVQKMIWDRTETTLDRSDPLPSTWTTTLSNLHNSVIAYRYYTCSLCLTVASDIRCDIGHRAGAHSGWRCRCSGSLRHSKQTECICKTADDYEGLLLNWLLSESGIALTVILLCTAFQQVLSLGFVSQFLRHGKCLEKKQCSWNDSKLFLSVSFLWGVLHRA